MVHKMHPLFRALTVRYVSRIMQLQMDNLYSHSLQVGKENGTFINLWMESYNTYTNTCWGCNSVLMANKLAIRYPHLVHIALKSLVNPNYNQNDQMYGSKYYNYTSNYAVHIFSEHHYFIPSNEEELKGYNCTLGRIMRHVLYGKSDLLDTKNVRNGIKNIL